MFNDCDYRLLSDDTPVSVAPMETIDKNDAENRRLYDDKAYRIIEADRIVDLGLTEEKTLTDGKKRKVKSKTSLILKSSSPTPEK